MQQAITEKPEMKFIGMGVRTNNVKEADKNNGLIFPLVMRYFHEQLSEKIADRKKPGTTLCVYTEYESDYQGDYSYFIGEEVSAFPTILPEGFQKILIPAQRYAKFTTPPQPMPQVIINAWQTVWKLSPKELGGQRNYKVDFELYDERAADHSKIVFDLYIGLRP